MEKIAKRGLAFDDVLVIPVLSDVQPQSVSTSARLSPGVELKIPFLSAGMDTVTESQMAIALARFGGLGVIHRHMPISSQATEVDRVKRSENGVISDPFSLSPNHYVYEADKLMGKYRISGVPIVEHDALVGIITNRDLRFVTDYSKKVYEVMTKDNLVTAPEGTSLEEAKAILTRHKVEKLPLVDEKGNLKGLITIKDINKSVKYPLAAKDSQGRLLAGAAVAIMDDYMDRVQALVRRKVDVIVLEFSSGMAKGVVAAIRQIKGDFPAVTLVAGNVATAESAAMLVDAGADCIKVGLGPSGVSAKRVVAGVGVPQITAIMDAAKAAAPRGIPVIADGGIKGSGDITKAIAAGASCCMMGNLFAGCAESPGTTELFRGRKCKVYRDAGFWPYDGPALLSDEAAQEADEPRIATIARGVEGRITFKGDLSDVLHQLLGGLAVGMSLAGCASIREMHEKARFVQVGPALIAEAAEAAEAAGTSARM